MKVLKYAAFVLGGLAALLAAIVLYVAITFDAVRLKDELRRVVQEQKQRTLEIEGDVDLSFYPNLGLSLGRTTLSEHASSERFAQIDGARVSVAVLPLLSGALVVDEIRVEGAAVNLVRHKDGSFNFEDLLSDESSESSPVKFDVAGLRVSRSVVNFRDEGAGTQHAAEDIELAVGKLANAARGKLDLSARVKASQPAVDSRVVLAATYDYDLATSRFALDDVALKIEGDAMQFAALKASLAAGRLALAGDDGAEVQKLSLDAAATLGGEALSVRLTSPSFTVGEDGVRAPELGVDGRIESSARNAVVKLQLKDIAGDLKAVRAASMRIDADAKIDALTVKAQLASPLSVGVEGPTVDLPAVEGSVEASHPALPMKTVKLPLKASLTADAGRQTARVVLDTRLDDSRIDLDASVTRFSPPALNFSLDIDRLDVDRYLPPARTGTTDAGKPAGKPDDVPIDLSALRGIDARGNVKIGELQVSGVRMSNVKLDMKADRGKLDVSPFSAALYRGSASGALSLNAEGNRIAFRQTLADIDILPLLKDVADKEILEGRGTLALDLSTAGATVGALKKALDGSASLKLRDGAIRGINLAKSLREAKARLSGGDSAVQKASATEKTDFSELSASFRIEDGIARNNDLQASSPFMRLAGAGTVDIPASSLDYLARVTLAATSKGQDGRAAADLRGLTVPVRLYGPFASLDYKIEFGDLLKEATRGQIDAQKQKLQDKAREKVGDKLKGLLGR